MSQSPSQLLKLHIPRPLGLASHCYKAFWALGTGGGADLGSTAAHQVAEKAVKQMPSSPLRGSSAPQVSALEALQVVG